MRLIIISNTTLDCAFSRNNLPRIKHGTYVINLNNKKSKGTHWVSLLIDRNTAVYFDSFGIEYISQEVLNKLKDKSITHKMFRVQGNDSIIYDFHFIVFIEYMLAGKTLPDYFNLISLNDYKKNDKMMYKYFEVKYVKSQV